MSIDLSSSLMRHGRRPAAAASRRASPRSRHEVIGEQVQFLGARPSESAKADDEPDYGPDEEAF